MTNLKMTSQNGDTTIIERDAVDALAVSLRGDLLPPTAAD